MTAQGKPMDDGAFQPVIDQLKAIVAQSGDALISEGPVHPDHKLLDIAAEALALVLASNARYATHQEMFTSEGGPWPQEKRDRANLICAEAHRLRRASTTLLRRASKIKAATAAGIYAKATLVRAARTEAAGLGASLADDLLALPALRRSLWPTAPEGTEP